VRLLRLPFFALVGRQAIRQQRILEEAGPNPRAGK
jgi:hypothetical protein